MRIVYGSTLRDTSFRRVLRTFQNMLTAAGSDDTNAHRIAWYLANDLYERLRSGEVQRSGYQLNSGRIFNKVRMHWSVLLYEAYPEIRSRTQLSYDLVHKAVYMLKHGRLVYEQ